MSTVYRIVVGVDGSPAATAALRWAFRQAAAHRGQVVAVCVWPWDPQRDLAYAQARQAEAEAVLSEAIATALGDNPRVAVNGLAVAGSPARALVEQSAGADLLVVGSRGRGRMAKAMLGSVAAECVRLAGTPVVVLPNLRAARVRRAGAVMGPAAEEVRPPTAAAPVA